ncbi:MAG TPA: EF-hand domain-containing protein [Lysobacter sp.]
MKPVVPLLLAIIATSSAFAAETPKTSTKPAAPVTDHSKSHAGHAAPDAFAALDKNKDGALSKAELSKHPMTAHASMVDANKDGVLNRSEFAALQGM